MTTVSVRNLRPVIAAVLWQRGLSAILKLQNFLRDWEVFLVAANKDSSRMRGAGKSVE
jgi:hypothetical protein